MNDNPLAGHFQRSGGDKALRVDHNSVPAN